MLRKNIFHTALWLSGLIIPTAGASPAQEITGIVRNEPVYMSVDFALAALPDRNISSIYQFVDQTMDVQLYAGVLRGATGTLWTQAGNSYDQSLLLSEMLRRAGYQTRYATCQLGVEQAGAVVSEIGPRRISPEEVPYVEDISETPGSILREFADRVEFTYALIEESLTAAGVIFEDEPAELAERRLAWATDHIWVQVLDDDKWANLDPVSGGVPAQPPCASAQQWVDIPASFFHQFDLELVTETYRDDAPVMQSHLSYSSTVAGATGVAFLLAHEAPEQDVVSILTQGSGEAFTPWLVTDQGVLEGSLIDFAAGGSEEEAPSGGGGGLFGGFSQVTNALEGTTPDELVAGWLRLTFRAPDGTTQIVDHLLFDRLGYAKRVAGNPDYAALTPKDMAWAETLSAFTITTGALPGGVATRRIEAMVSGDPLAAAAASGGMMIDLYGYLRETLPSMIYHLDGVTSYPSGPNLMFLTLQPGTENQPGRFALDHALKNRELVALSDTTLTPYERIFDGVIDHETERLTASPLSWPGELDDTMFISVGDVIDMAEYNKIPLSVLLPSQQDLTTISASDEALARMARTLMQSAVLAPVQSVTLNDRSRTGWWAINNRTGATWDEMDDGTHQAGAEYNSNNAKKGTMGARARQMLCNIGSIAVSVSTALGPVGPDLPPGLMQGAQQVFDSCSRRGGGGGRPRPRGGGGASPPKPPDLYPPGPRYPFPPPSVRRPPSSQLPPRSSSPLPPRGRPVPVKPFHPHNPTRPAPLRRG